jgi:hypothetical protein
MSAMSAISTTNYYYVYEWWAEGADSPFYIGKGCKKRAWTYNGRSHKFIEVINTLTEKKIKTEVRIIYNNLSNDEALRKESERIAFWVRVFATLANISKIYRKKKKQLQSATSNANNLPKIAWSASEVIPRRKPKARRTAACIECKIIFPQKGLKYQFCSSKCSMIHKARKDYEANKLRPARMELQEAKMKARHRLQETERITSTRAKMKSSRYPPKEEWIWMNYIVDGHQAARRVRVK